MAHSVDVWRSQLRTGALINDRVTGGHPGLKGIIVVLPFSFPSKPVLGSGYSSPLRVFN